MDKNKEREIAEGLKQGKRQAWQQLYEAYSEPIWKGISRLVCNDSSVIADIVQETFMEAARSAANFNSARGCLWNWLWIIARRQVALYYRKQKPDALLSRAQNWWESLNGEKSDWLDAKADIPLKILESLELAALVRHSLCQLPADYQMLLLAKYVDNFSAEDIAERMSYSQTAVRSKLARARKAFRRSFRKNAGNMSDSHEVML